MATRSERRDSGSALVWSRMRPSHPSAAAFRTIEPTLTGLSTASATTSRRADEASPRTDGRAGRSNSARIDSGKPIFATSVRMADPPPYSGQPSSPAMSGMRSVSTSAAVGTHPARNARSTTRSPSARNSPAPASSRFCARLASARSLTRNCPNRGSSGSSMISMWTSMASIRTPP